MRLSEMNDQDAALFLSSVGRLGQEGVSLGVSAAQVCLGFMLVQAALGLCGLVSRFCADSEGP